MVRPFVFCPASHTANLWVELGFGLHGQIPRLKKSLRLRLKIWVKAHGLFLQIIQYGVSQHSPPVGV